MLSAKCRTNQDSDCGKIPSERPTESKVSDRKVLVGINSYDIPQDLRDEPSAHSLVVAAARPDNPAVACAMRRRRRCPLPSRKRLPPLASGRIAKNCVCTAPSRAIWVCASCPAAIVRACARGEIEASGQLKVSRSAYREAVRMLAAKGLVQSRTRTGTRVSAVEQWHLLDPDVLAWVLRRARAGSAAGLFELRTDHRARSRGAGGRSTQR